MDSEHPVEVVHASDDDLCRTASLHVSQLPHGLFPLLGPGFVWRWHRAHTRSRYGTVLVARRRGVVVGFLVGTTDRRANVAWIIREYRIELVLAAIRAFARHPLLAWSFLRTRGSRYARRMVRPDSDPRAVGGSGERGPVTWGGSSLGIRGDHSPDSCGGSGSDASGGSGPVAPRGSGPDFSGGSGPDVRGEPRPDADGATGRLAVLEAVVVDFPERGNGIGTRLVETFLADVARTGVDRVELVTKADARGAGAFYQRTGWTRVGCHVDRDGDEVWTFRIDPHASRTR